MNKLHTSYSNVALWKIRQDSNGLRIYCSLGSLIVTLLFWWAAIVLFVLILFKLIDDDNVRIIFILISIFTAVLQAAIVIPLYIVNKRKGDYLVVNLAEKSVQLPQLKKVFFWDGSFPVFRLDFYKDPSDEFSEFNLQTSDGNVYPILKLLGFGYKFSGVDKKLRAMGFEVQEHRHKLSE